MKRHYFCLLITFNTLISWTFAQVPSVSDGVINHLENFASKYVAPRNVDIWLPPNYDTNKKYSVLYMQDGMALFDSTITWNHQEWGVDEVLSSMFQEGKLNECIVVGVWNNGSLRQSEYFPQKVFESLTKDQQELYYKAELFNTGQPLLGGKVQSDNYLKFIVYELKPFVDSSYSVYTDREHTFVAGSSYGGLISIYSICEYPDVFGKAVCMSTHWPGLTERNEFIPDAICLYLSKNLPDPQNHSIYFDYGTMTIDSLYKPCQVKVDKIMSLKGYDNNNWVTKEFVGKDHTENSWNERFQIPMSFILKKD